MLGNRALARRYHFKLHRALTLCQTQGSLPQHLDIDLATYYLDCIVGGIILNWVKDPDCFKPDKTRDPDFSGCLIRFATEYASHDQIADTGGYVLPPSVNTLQNTHGTELCFQAAFGYNQHPFKPY